MKYAIIVMLVAAVMFVGLTLVPDTVGYEKETNKGCEASAYQATRYGHDLEANLAACE